MPGFKRKGSAVWRGNLRDGTGEVSSESGALQSVGYGFRTRFGDTPGCNPEELLASAHAACYAMALSNTMAQAGHTPRSVSVEAVCSLEPKDGGFGIAAMALDVTVDVDDVSEEVFQTLVEQGDAGCPVSNLLRPGLTISITAEKA